MTKWVIILVDTGETLIAANGRRYFDSEGCADDYLKSILGSDYEASKGDYLIIDMEVS